MLGLAALVGHLFGDYVLQNGWMATNKGRSFFALMIHCTLYTAAVCAAVCFAGARPHAWQMELVWGTHALLDGTTLVKRLWGRLNGAPAEECPVWLRIVIDNTFHLATLLILIPPYACGP